MIDIRDYNSQKCCPNIFKFTKLNSFPFFYLGGGGVSASVLLYFVNIKSNSLKLTKWTLKRNKLCSFLKEIMDQHQLNSLKCPHGYTLITNSRLFSIF